MSLSWQDISKCTIESVRACIGLVPQDVTLFNDTILYNVKVRLVCDCCECNDNRLARSTDHLVSLRVCCSYRSHIAQQQDATDEEAFEAARAAQLHGARVRNSACVLTATVNARVDFVVALPKGYVCLRLTRC
jgi:hypothetical protein